MMVVCFNYGVGRISVFSLTHTHDIFTRTSQKFPKDEFMGAGNININIESIFNLVVKPISFGI